MSFDFLYLKDLNRLICKSRKHFCALLPFAVSFQPKRLYLYPYKDNSIGWHGDVYQTTVLARLYISTYVITKNITRPNFTWLKRSLFLIYGFQIYLVTNNTECGKLLEEIKCALCSPHSQSLFHSPEREALERDLVFPLLCKDYCKEFFYTCRGHIPGKKMGNLNKLLQNILTR